MPSAASRSAYSVVSMEMPALETQYSPRFVLETTEEQLEMLTIAPLLCAARHFSSKYSCAIICLATFCVRNIFPFVLVPTTKSKLSSVISSRSLRTFGATPALLTSTSIRPKRSTAACTIRCPEVISPLSACT